MSMCLPAGAHVLSAGRNVLQAGYDKFTCRRQCVYMQLATSLHAGGNALYAGGNALYAGGNVLHAGYNKFTRRWQCIICR